MIIWFRQVSRMIPDIFVPEMHLQINTDLHMYTEVMESVISL